MSLSAWPVTDVSVRPKRSLATMVRPLRPAALANSCDQPSPYASENPMNPTVLIPIFCMCSAMASDIMMSFCGVLKTHLRLASIGSTMRAEAAIEIIGVSASAATSIMPSEAGVTVEPRMMSTLCSARNLRALLTAAVVSDASSSTM